jgi:rhodanese-related sulfurtransferase
MTLDEMLLEARSVLTPRLNALNAYTEMQQGALLVDIRYFEQRDRDGDILGALVIGRNEFEWRCDPAGLWRDPKIKQNDFTQRIIVLCNQGFQSSLAAANLVRIGLTNVTDVEGGMESWLSSGLPTMPLAR